MNRPCGGLLPFTRIFGLGEPISVVDRRTLEAGYQQHQKHDAVVFISCYCINVI
jgi:hypothetical protein